jgi:hypothetical protein
MFRFFAFLSLLSGFCVACSGKSFEPGAESGGGGPAGAGGSGASAGRGAGGASGMGGLAGTGGAGGLAGSGGAAGEPPVLETVVVVDELGKPAAGCDVITNTAEGTFFARGKTDATGTVMLDVPEGGSASAVWSASVVDGQGTVLTFHQLWTVAGVAQGATVHALVQSFDAPKKNAPMGDITLVVADGFPAGTSTVEVNLPCLSTSVTPSSPIVVKDYVGCPGETSYDVFLLARSATGKLLGHALVSALTFSPGQTASHNLSFVSATEQLFVTVDGFSGGSAHVSAVLDGYRPNQPHMPITAVGSGTASPTMSATLELPGGGVLPKLVFTQDIDWTEGPNAISVRTREPLSGLPATSHWTFPGTLAWAATLAEPDLSKPGQPRFAWTLGDGALGDCVWFMSVISRGPQEAVFWTATLPPSKVGEHRIPELPADLSAPALVAGDQVKGYEVVNAKGAPTDGLCAAGAPTIPTQKLSYTQSRFGSFDL